MLHGALGALLTGRGVSICSPNLYFDAAHRTGRLKTYIMTTDVIVYSMLEARSYTHDRQTTEQLSHHIIPVSYQLNILFQGSIVIENAKPSLTESMLRDCVRTNHR